MVRQQVQVAAIVAQDTNVEHFMSRVNSGNQGGISMRLKALGHRLPAEQVARELTRKIAQAVPGMQIFLQLPQAIRIGGRPSKTLYQFTLQSSDIAGLYQSAAQLEAKLRLLPMLRDVTSDLQIKNPQVSVHIDRDRAAALGLTVEQIEQGLYDAYGAHQVSTIYTPNNQYWVIIELLPQYQKDLAGLNLLYIRSKTGDLVPLASLARLTTSMGPLTVGHSGQMPAVTLSFNLQPGVALGDAVDRVQKAADQILPASVTTQFAGTAQAFQAAQQGLLMLLILSILVIYIVLGVLYESFIHPITILSGLPFAGFGALLTLFIFRMELSIYAFVGIIMLIGLVKKNAIMMIDFALNTQREHNKSPRDAILEACVVRFRPIMMTTMAALMGTLPIALGVGAGSESRRPLGVAVVGGLAFSQLITLYITPVVYTYLDAFQQRLQARSAARAARRAAPTVPATSGGAA
jgi:HAE1 family hydrophobic/amphiphilic exporter-1